MKSPGILIMTPPGLTSDGQQVFFYPSRWSAATGQFKTVTYYPYELAYLSSMLKQRCPQYETRMLDPSYYGVGEEEYCDILLGCRPDILVVESDMLMHEHLMNAVDRARRKGLECTFILAGPHGTAMPEQGLAAGADYVVMGEFEEAVCRFIESGLRTPSPGIYPDTTRLLVDMASLPLPEDADIKRRNYCRSYMLRHNAVHVYASRGCPCSCDFCVAANLYYGKPNLRCRPVLSVIDELKYLFSSIPELEGVMFDEESHTFNRAWVLSLCKAIVEAGLSNYKFACMTNYSTLDRELLESMKRAGYYKILFGVESLSSENTRSFLKTGQKSNTDKLMHVLEVCREIDMEVYVTITLGSHGASVESDYRTIRSVESLYEKGLIHEFQVSVNMPMPGTPFYEHCQKAGYLHTWKGGLFPEPITMASHDGYTARQIMHMYYYGFGLQQTVIDMNRRKGIRYSNDDADGWCKPVFDLKYRKKGTGILSAREADSHE